MYRFADLLKQSSQIGQGVLVKDVERQVQWLACNSGVRRSTIRIGSLVCASMKSLDKPNDEVVFET